MNMILLPEDFGSEALNDPQTRSIMQKIDFEHGGVEYDS
jgi:2-methylcitrate dehydratase